jgi:hypothetical protein
MSEPTEKTTRPTKPAKARHTVFVTPPVDALVRVDAEKGAKSISEVIASIVEAHYRAQGRLP